MGKTSDMDGYYTNMRVPFYKSIRLTAQLPKGHDPFAVYTIVRGQENVPLVIGGYDLSSEKPKLVTYTNTQVEKASLEFTAIVNKTDGAGVIWGHTLGIEGNKGFTYLEGFSICLHLTCLLQPVQRELSVSVLTSQASHSLLEWRTIMTQVSTSMP